MRIAFDVNGARHEVEASGLEPLLDVLRDRLGLLGTKEGCTEGECGACTVLLDGQEVCSCLVPVVHAAGRSVVTIEGVGLDEGDMHPIQRALVESGPECGFCLPGIVLVGHAYITRAVERDHAVDEEDIRRAISGNLCRCTGYTRLVGAVAIALAHVVERRAEGESTA